MINKSALIIIGLVVLVGLVAIMGSFPSPGESIVGYACRDTESVSWEGSESATKLIDSVSNISCFVETTVPPSKVFSLYERNCSGLEGCKFIRTIEIENLVENPTCISNLNTSFVIALGKGGSVFSCSPQHGV